MITELFTTPVQRTQSGLNPEQLAGVEASILELMSRDRGGVLSNRGGWRSSGNLFDNTQIAGSLLRESVIAGARRYLIEVCSCVEEAPLKLTAWAVVNGPNGDFNLPHNHPSALISGVVYITIPNHMNGGELYFQDARFNLNAYHTSGMEKYRAKPAWLTNLVAVKPVSGELLVFPSWLVHWVMPYTCDHTPCRRIAVAFNVVI
jgi:uncharacterized protein (TIGR02466 family)